MDAALVLIFVATFTSILILPGPNVMFAVGQSLKYGFIGSIYVSLGFMASTGIQAALVFSGLGVLVSKYASALLILKWLGVAYHIYLAYKLFRKNGGVTEGEEKAMSKPKMFVTAMLFSLTNPKAVLASVLTYPLFISPVYPFIPQAFILAACAMAISFSVYGAYSLSASVFKNRAIKSKWGNKFVGSLYLMAAGTLASKST
jgi:threonine/homoserine/homoserine lactone efflux protein